MQKLKLLPLLLLIGCGTYRTGVGKYQTGVGEYNGVGEFRTGSDYATDENPEAYGYKSTNGAEFVPHGPFGVVWPVVNVKINRGFRPKSDPRHAGVDLGGTSGAPISSAHEGIVVYAGHDFRGYGNMVLIEYNNEWATLYAHLKEIKIAEGMVLGPGAIIGTMGATGRATGVHLHFELLRNRKPVDPLPFLGKNQSYVMN